jgi:hypothetical protein
VLVNYFTRDLTGRNKEIEIPDSVPEAFTQDPNQARVTS